MPLWHAFYYKSEEVRCSIQILFYKQERRALEVDLLFASSIIICVEEPVENPNVSITLPNDLHLSGRDNQPINMQSIN